MADTHVVTKVDGVKAYASLSLFHSDNEILLSGTLASITVVVNDIDDVEIFNAVVSVTTTEDLKLSNVIRDLAKAGTDNAMFNMWVSESSRFDSRLNVMPWATGFSSTISLPVFTPGV